VKRLALLGATGSVGLSTLDVVRAFPEAFQVASVSGGNNWRALAEVAREFRPELVAIAREAHEPALREALADLPCRVLAGPGGVVEAAAGAGAHMLVSAAVGAAGLDPTLAAIDAGMDVALANKETLVMAGRLVVGRAGERGVTLWPVDSEHSALYQCLRAGRESEVRRLVLTASGGPFRGRARGELARVRAAEALVHPTWRMGRKITVDSATLANKALEVIEAHWLFGLAYERIEVLVHPQSVVHGLVEFADGSTVAQLSRPDMKLPIQYALFEGARRPGPVAAADLARLGTLTFETPDREAFPCLDLGVTAGRAGGVAAAVFSSANEAAVDLFLHDEIEFLDIPRLIERALAEHTPVAEPTLEAVHAADRWARESVRAGAGVHMSAGMQPPEKR